MVLATLLLAPTLIQGTLQKPAWLDDHIAGYVLESSDRFAPVGVFDPKLGYYLVRGIECDGAHLHLILTRDREVVSGDGFAVPSYNKPYGNPLVLKSLRSLSTGKGIKIGDSVAQVKARLGKPTTIAKTGKRNQFDELTYHWRKVKNGEGYEWFNTYTFKKGKLIEIDFDREAVPGC